jgi:hypothetical protein
MAHAPRFLGSLLLALLALPALSLAIAQDGAQDDPSPVEQDAGQVLGERADPPDLSVDAPPTGFQQVENAGSAHFSTSSSEHTETVTETREHSSGFSVGMDAPEVPVAGEIANNPPPPPGWPGARHANHPVPSGAVTQVDAGPIWNNDDAQDKCPQTCARAGGEWNGDWRTVGARTSVCDCVAAGHASSPPYAGGRGTSCSVPQNFQCRGCAVSCPAGQAAHCTQGDRGIFNKPDSTICATDAKCECR